MSSYLAHVDRADTACFIDPKVKLNNKLDILLSELHAKGMTYAEWQKERYPVKVDKTGKRKTYGVIK